VFAFFFFAVESLLFCVHLRVCICVRASVIEVALLQCESLSFVKSTYLFKIRGNRVYYNVL
jgi:hypothetical protein